MVDAAARPSTYRQAGVDIDAAAVLAERIGALAGRTRRAEVLSGVGGFGALVRLPLKGYKQPVLVSSTDGVGTKLKIAQHLGRHRGIGIDLVGMVVNDLLPSGASPLFFLDYVAVGKLEPQVVHEIVAGVADGCEQAGCALVGGETAEMPGVYPEGSYDVAGFGVAVVEEDHIVDGSSVEIGDAIVGLASSGLHSNGFSLVRTLLPLDELSPQEVIEPLERPLGEELLAPTRIYVAVVADLMAEVSVRAMAHITGGGLLENVQRTLPESMAAELNGDAWTRPPIFRLLARRGSIAREEMFRTFNCGIGYTLAVSNDDVDTVLAVARKAGIEAWQIGEVVAAQAKQPRVMIR